MNIDEDQVYLLIVYLIKYEKIKIYINFISQPRAIARAVQTPMNIDGNVFSSHVSGKA